MGPAVRTFPCSVGQEREKAACPALGDQGCMQDPCSRQWGTQGWLPWLPKSGDWGRDDFILQKPKGGDEHSLPLMSTEEWQLFHSWAALLWSRVASVSGSPEFPLQVVLVTPETSSTEDKKSLNCEHCRAFSIKT